MRNIIFILIACCIATLYSCDEEQQGQFPVDTDAPGQVSDVTVANFNGYSEISFTIPNDKDLLYIEASHKNSRNEDVVITSSAFIYKLIVPGFLHSAKVPVKLVSVDKSKNRSEAVNIEIEPLESNMFAILASVNVTSAFGGVKVSWVNETEMDVVLEVLKFDSETNKFEGYANIFNSSPVYTKAIRGLEPVEQEVGVVLRDASRQRTDTLITTVTPLFEQFLDPANFKELPFHPEFDKISYSTGWNGLWDDNGEGSYSIFGDNLGSVWFGIDMKEEVKLSRFKMWCRTDFIYKHSHPKHFKIWGTNDPVVANDAESFDGWTLMGEWDDEKPSGNTASGGVTEDDIAYFKSGMDFEVPIEASSYRYIRWETLETWGGTDRMWLSDLKFWGQIKNGENE